MGSMAVRWLLLILTGCSLTLSGPDPNRPRNKLPVCDTSKSLVALDGVLAATMGIIAAAAASSNDGGAAVAPALFGAVFVASAIHGNSEVNACHREMENYDAMMAARETVPEDVPPPKPVERPVAVAPPGMQPPPQPEPQPQEPPELQEPPQPPPQPQPRAQPQPPPAPAGDRWQAFWREVP